VSWNSGLTKIASRQTIIVPFRDKYKVLFLFVASHLGGSFARETAQFVKTR
jgi:hypothetical protein